MEEKSYNLNKEILKSTEEISNKNYENNLEYNNNKEFETDNNLNEINQDFTLTYDIKSSPKNKNDKMISLDTLVYEILNPGESRSKNYDKISLEIKNVEQIAKIEKAKLKKKINLINKRLTENNETKESNIKDIKEDNKEEYDNQESKILNLQMKKLVMMEYERDKKYNFIEVIQKLKIPPEKRKIRDIIRIKTFIDQSNLGLNFREEFSDINTAEKLIHFCCIEMRYKKFRKGEIIVKIGDPPESFYTIIFGKAKIIEPIPKIQSLTGFQYFKYLMDLKKKKEDYIFMRCIKINKENYLIEPNDKDIIHYIYLLNYLEHIKTINDQTINFDKVLNLLDITPEEIGIEPDSVNNNYYINDNLNKIKKNLPEISQNIMVQYSFIMDNINKNEVTIFEYKSPRILKANDYFGDSAIETNSPRKATIIAEEDTDLAYLSNKLYYNQIASEKAILLQIKIKNMHQNFFFHRIQYYKFSKKYFTWFRKEKYNKGDILFKEDEIIKYLYFIQEGSVEITFNKSMNEIEELINIMKNKEELLVRNNYIDIHLNIIKNLYNKNIQNKENSYDYDPINSSFKDIAYSLDQKHNNKIIILNDNEEFGILSYFLGNYYLGTCKVFSKNAKIYKIETDYLNQMLESEVEIKWDFYRRLKNKLKLYSERLFKINNCKLVMTDEKIKENNKDLKINEQLEKEKEKEINNTINKTLINFDKINIFLNERKDNNSSCSSGANKTIRISHKQLKNTNLPLLNNNINNNRNKNRFNFSLPFLNNFNDENKFKENNILRVSKLEKKNLKFNNIKLYNIFKKENNENNEIISKKTFIEDNMLSQIQKDFLSFSQSKYTISKDKIKLDDIIYCLDKKHGSLSLNKNNDQLYITEVNNEKNNMSKINEMSDQSISIESQSPRNIKNIKYIKYYNQYRSLSYDNKRYNTENNNIINNNKRDFIIGNNNNIKFKKKYNHPYYDPLTLIKKEQYKIFDTKDYNLINNKSKKDYLHSHLDRLRKLKKLRNSMKNNYRIKFMNVNNI